MSQCPHVNSEQQHVIIFDRVSGLPEFCLDVRDIKLKGHAGSAIGFGPIVRILFKRQRGTCPTRVLIQIWKENSGRDLSIEAGDSTRCGPVIGKQQAMTMHLRKELSHAVQMHQFRGNGILGWSGLLLCLRALIVLILGWFKNLEA